MRRQSVLRLKRGTVGDDRVNMAVYLKDENYRDLCESLGKVHDIVQIKKMTKRRKTLMKNHEELVQMRKIIRGLES